MRKHSTTNFRLRTFSLLRRCLSTLTISVVSCSVAYAAGGWSYHQGKGYTLCDALLKRLNSYSYPDPIKQPNACAWNVMLSYPGFTEPPWQELDPKKNEELIYRLFTYSESGGGLREHLSPESYRRDEVKQLIEQGGRVQLWRTRLINSFGNQNHPEIWAPPGLQNVVQLRYPQQPQLNTSTAPCPDVLRASWIGGRVFIVNSDISDIHPDLGSYGPILSGSTLVLYKSRPHFLSREASLTFSVGWDIGIGPDSFCELGITDVPTGATSVITGAGNGVPLGESTDKIVYGRAGNDTMLSDAVNSTHEQADFVARSTRRIEA